MAGVLRDRDQSNGAKWAHDDEALCRIMAKRDAWLGKWAAEAMQLPASEVDRYVKEVVNAGLTGKGKEAVLEKIREDFSMRMLGCPDAVIETKMKDLFNQASESILAKRNA